MSSFHSGLDRLPIRSLQALGIELFDRFCESRNLNHSDLDELVDFFWRALSVEDLIVWSESTPELACVGLGDPLRSAWVDFLDHHGVDSSQFHLLLGCLVEISFVNLYAAVQKEESLRFVRNILTIVDGHGVRSPDPGIFPLSDEDHGWGRPISERAATEIRSICLRDRRS